jgi:hypothetical protein
MEKAKITGGSFFMSFVPEVGVTLKEEKQGTKSYQTEKGKDLRPTRS